MSKYNAKRTEVDGIIFASKKEAARYGQLKLMYKAGLIEFPICQPKYLIEINGRRICTYIADFAYRKKDDPEGDVIIEDVKGMKTPVYNLKKKLMKAVHGIEIKEV